LTVNPLDQLGDPLRIVTTAVTPVVMVSATAILLSGVNSRYLAVSDRIRALAHEYRDESVTAARRRNIQQQMLIFHLRMDLVSWSSRILYVAICCFISVALLICLSTWRQMLTAVTLPIFSLGVLMVGTAVVLQLLEVQASRRTIALEAEEMMRDAKDLAS
jgi:anti-sigma factor RsiW